jgi:hypothetical protein
MNYIIAASSFLLGIYSFKFMISILTSKHELSNLKIYDKIIYFISFFLFVTFPFVNIISALEILIFNSYIFSYASGVYGLTFIMFYFLDTDEQNDKI